MRKADGMLAYFLASAALAAAPAAGQETAGFGALSDAAARGEIAAVERALLLETDANARALLTAQLVAARLDPAAARDPDLVRIAEEGDAHMRRAALSVLAGAAFADGDYEAAARYGRPLAEALAAAGEAEAAASASRMAALARLLAGHPSMRVEGAVAAQSVPLRYDRVGLPRIDLGVNGQAQEAVVDTGANLSVLSRDTALRLGVEILADETPVDNGVDSTVPVRLGIADRVEIAGTVLRNVAFLIINDEQLTFPVPGGYDIRAIIGLPELRALGRVRVENGGRFTVVPGPASAGPANLSASGNNLFIDVEAGGHAVPLHLDTGANQTTLSARWASAHPESVAGLETSEVQTASAGGARRAQVATWRQAPLSLAGRALVLPSLPVSLPAEGAEPPTFYGTLGSNALRAFESYTIDFAAMRLDIGPPAAR